MYDKAIGQISAQLDDDLEVEESSWVVSRIESMFVNFAIYSPFRGESYIETPSCIPKRAVINVKNTNNRYFEWEILSAKYPADPHAYCTSNYNQYL